MAVKIRLARAGRTHLPFYRIVVADSREARDGRFIAQIGTYDPLKGIKSATINEEVAIKYINSGAQYSDTVKAILKEKGVLVKAKEARSKVETVKKEKVVKTKSTTKTKSTAAKPKASTTTKTKTASTKTTATKTKAAATKTKTNTTKKETK